MILVAALVLAAPATAAVVLGTPSNDNLSGTSQPDEMFGFEGRDYLEGRGASDQLDGGPGGDRLHGQRGNDLLKGGQGNESPNSNQKPSDGILNGGNGQTTSEEAPATTPSTAARARIASRVGPTPI